MSRVLALSHALSASGTGTPSISRAEVLSHTLSVSASATPTLAMLTARFRTLSVTATEAASITDVVVRLPRIIWAPRTPHMFLTFNAPYNGRTKGARLDGIDLNPRKTALKTSSALPGGYESLSAGLGPELFTPDLATNRQRVLDRTVAIQGFAHVELHAGLALVWEGRVQQPKSPAGRIQSFTAQGYGFTATKDGIFRTKATRARSSGIILRTMLASAAPILLPSPNSEQFVDPGTHHLYSEVDAKYPGQALDQFGKEGGGSNTLWDYLVYQMRYLQFVPRTPPALPDYHIDFTQAAEWDEDYSDTWGTVTVQYADVGSGAAREITVTNPLFLDRYGFLRSTVVSGGTMIAGAAAQFASTYLAAHFLPTISCTFRGTGLTARGGYERAGYMTMGGEWAEVADQPFLLPIVRAEYDYYAESLALEMGQPAFGFAQLVNGLQATQQYVARSTNPTTGAPQTYNPPPVAVLLG
jgi:hypothetical protein